MPYIEPSCSGQKVSCSQTLSFQLYHHCVLGAIDRDAMTVAARLMLPVRSFLDKRMFDRCDDVGGDSGILPCFQSYG